MDGLEDMGLSSGQGQAIPDLTDIGQGFFGDEENIEEQPMDKISSSDGLFDDDSFGMSSEELMEEADTSIEKIADLDRNGDTHEILPLGEDAGDSNDLEFLEQADKEGKQDDSEDIILTLDDDYTDISPAKAPASFAKTFIELSSQDMGEEAGFG